jgi:hypothetical protein
LRDVDRDGKPKLFWMFTVWHVDEEKPMVFEVTQSTIKTPILAYAKNPAWGDPSHYVLEIGRTGSGLETEYTVIAEPPSEPPPKAVTDAMKDAMIDLRVVFKDDNPFGALVVDDQVNIQELRDAGEPIPMPKDKQPEESLSSVGSITRDAIETLKAAKDKATGVAPEMKDGMPY